MKKKLVFYSNEDIKEMENILVSSTSSIKAISYQLFNNPQFSNHTRRSIEQKLIKINKGLFIPHRVNTKKKAKTFLFYSKEEINEMIEAISTTNEPMSSLARKFAVKYNRGVQGVTTKLHTLANDIVRPAKEKKSYYIRKTKEQALVKIKVEKANVPVPQVLGINVPEGTSFDIKNVKRVVLQKDCFTIYF